VAHTFPFPSRPATGVRIHSTALVDPTADLGVEVDIGPYSIIEAGTRLGDRTRVFASAFVAAGAEIGPDCEIHFGAVIGHTPQIRELQGSGGRTVIGARTIIREHASVHRASRPDACTIVGCDNFLMGASHVAHDCRTGEGVTIANGALLAGCVSVGDKVFISGNVVVHQFVRIGDLAMIGGGAQVGRDVPPYMVVVGRSEVCGVNVVGMRRAHLTAAERLVARRAYHLLYRTGYAPARALEQLRAERGSAVMDHIVTFIEGSTRGLCEARTRPRRPPAERR
jgi:UDP-N-acetylglucosamine acyltransferase